MGMKSMDNIRDMLCEEVEKISKKGELKMTEIDNLHKMIDTIKNIDKIEMLEEEGISNGDGMWVARGDYSNARNGRTNRMNYSNNDSDYRTSRRNNGYSRADSKEMMLDHLEDMMNDAESEKEKDAIRRCMNTIKNG